MAIGGSAGAIARRVGRRKSGGRQTGIGTSAYGTVPSGGASATIPSSTSSGRYSAPAPPPSGGAGPVASIGGGGGGGGGRSRPAPEPSAPSMKRFLARDTDYQRQLRQLQQSMRGFRGDVRRKKGRLYGETQTSRRALGQQREKDLEEIEADYAARGLGRSGLYGEAVGEYEKEYGERRSDLETRLREALAELKGESRQYRSKYKLSRQEAREAAAERRAARYGL